MKTILIADDAPVFRQLEEGLLRPLGYTIIHASNGAQAIKLAVDKLPDLILLDVQMPVMDGAQALQFLKNDERTGHIPIVMVTMLGRDTERSLLQQAGANAFLTKPINPTHFSTTIRQLLEPNKRE
ncbi:MAG: response regulator [Deltaproteobacteria bacterium]|nr:response regulator [Deltaproteobacteria bacterium]